MHLCAVRMHSLLVILIAKKMFSHLRNAYGERRVRVDDSVITVMAFNCKLSTSYYGCWLKRRLDIVVAKYR